MNTRARPLPRSLTFWYAIGAVPGGIGASTASFLVFFYNQVLGVPGSLIGLVFFAIALFDAVSDPVAGVLSDRTRSRLGRRHPYLVWAMPPAVLCGIAIWLPPGSLGTTGIATWLLVALVASRSFDTLVAVPYLALGAELTKDYVERTRLTALRATTHNAGRAAGGALLLLFFLRPTAEYPDGQMNPDGYAQFAIAAGIVSLVAMWSCAWGTRRSIPELSRSLPGSDGPGPIATVFREIRDALALRDFRAIFGATISKHIGWGISDALGLYVATFFWEVGTEGLFLWGTAMFTGLFTGFPIWRFLAGRFDKKPLYVAGTAIYGVFFSVPYLLKVAGLFPSDPTVSFALYVFLTGFVAHLGLAAPAIVQPSMLGDVTDVDELATGKRREGVLFAAETFGWKALRGIGALSAGLIIDLVGLTQGVTPETVDATVSQRLGLALGLSMALFTAGALWFIRGYRIDRHRHEQVRAALAARAAEQESSERVADPGEA
ncbi:MAG: MFS transporter [Myxococcota bacterium]|nr:MFS transporter [Myxococcota bacterium]